MPAHRKHNRWRRALLFLPLAISTSWMIVINAQSKIPGSELLSPIPQKPLFTALIAFSAGYIIFLALLFSDDIKRFFADKKRN